MFEQIAKDIHGSEGPLVTNDGRIFVVEPRTGSILEIDRCGGKNIVANTGGVPAGLQLHRDESLWVADMKLGILRITLDGQITPIVTSFGGRPIRGCNDCTFDSQGNLYFTAPAGSSHDAPIGEVFCRLADGNVRKLGEGFAFCNGIAISADDRLLVIAETFTKRLHGYRLSEAGRVIDKFIFATLSGDHSVGPDGIDFDERGRLIATNWGATYLEVFSPGGELERQVPLPFAKASNLHFLGTGSRELLITEHTHNGLWKTIWECAGQKQFGWR